MERRGEKIKWSFSPKVHILQKENERCMEPLQFYLTVCLMLGLYWMAGALLLPLLAEVEKLSPSARLFLRLVLGFFGTTVLVALYYTSGYTVMALTLPVFGVILWLRRKEIRRISTKDFGVEWKAAAEVLAAAALLVLVQLYRNDYFNAEVLSMGAYDFGIYATVAEYLKISGIETSSPWYQLFAESADGLAKPYHYGDLWSLALLFDLSPAAPIDNYIYVWIPLVNAVLFSGFTAVFRMVSGRQGWLGPIVAFMVLFLNMYMEVWDWSWAFEGNQIIMPKMVIIQLCLTAWGTTRPQSLKYLGWAYLSFLIVSDILFLPIVCGAFAGFHLFSRYFLKTKIDLTYLAILIFTPIIILIFYATLGSFQTSSDTISPPGDEGYVYWFIKMLVASQVKYYIFFSPVILSVLLLSMRHRLIFELIVSLLLVSFFGSVIHGFFNNNFETFQFPKMAHVSSVQVMTPIAIAVLTTNGKNKALRFIILIIVFFQLVMGMYNSIVLYPYRDISYSRAFIQQTKNTLQGKSTIGVSVRTPIEYWDFQADPRMCYACNFLKKIGPGYWANQISIPEDMSKLEFPERRTAIELSPFYRFNEQYKREAPDYTFEKAQTAFINQYEVDFIVIEKGARHPAWLAGCTDTLLTDPVSGTQLMTLKRPCLSK